MPNNWSYVGLIHLMLPGAKIIDVRRHPLACCFANFPLYFNRNTIFASSLEDLVNFYRAYVELMDHFDKALLGRFPQDRQSVEQGIGLSVSVDYCCRRTI